MLSFFSNQPQFRKLPVLVGCQLIGTGVLETRMMKLLTHGCPQPCAASSEKALQH